MESGVPIVNHLPDFEGRDRLYDTLDEESRQIRVIELLGSNDRESPLRCRLITTDLEAERRQYTALSYYWEDLDSTEIILVKRVYPTVDETRFEVPITSALAAGLREIRAQATTRAPSTCLWVDAICINQTNIPERNYQVKIMYDILAASHGVVGWLGELTTEIDQSLSWLIGLYTWKEVPVDINPSVREQILENTNIEPIDIQSHTKGLTHHDNEDAGSAGGPLFSIGIVLLETGMGRSRIGRKVEPSIHMWPSVCTRTCRSGTIPVFEPL